MQGIVQKNVTVLSSEMASDRALYTPWIVQIVTLHSAQYEPCPKNDVKVVHKGQS